MLILILLLMVVFILLIFPIKSRVVDFDEKGEAIRVYKDEVAYLERQFAKGFIETEEKKQLLLELDKKSALAMLAIEKKTYTYQRSLVPLVLIFVGLTLATAVYFYYYQKNGVLHWQQFSQATQGQVIEALFDTEVVYDMAENSQRETAEAFCFAMQEVVLKKYDTNPEPLSNLARCHLLVGYPQLAMQAAERGLKTDPEHVELNYLIAEADFLQHQQLSTNTLNHLLKALEKKPKHFKGLRLLAMNSLVVGDYQQAKVLFTELIKMVPDNPVLLDALEKVSQAIDQRLVQPPNAHGQQADLAISESDATKHKPATVSLSLAIQLSEAMQALLADDQVMFVVVKSLDGQLLNASKYPIGKGSSRLSVIISDHQAGTMQMQPMAGKEAVNVVARVSFSGSPIAQSGDLSSSSLRVNLPQVGETKLLIDQVVP